MDILMSALMSLMGADDDLPRRLADPAPAEEVDDDDETLALLRAAAEEEDGQEPPQDPPQDPPKPDDFRLRPEERYEAPHDSLRGFFSSHFSARAWEENVWRDYLTDTPVLVPLALAAGAALVSHWDKPIQRALRGALGDREWIGDGAMFALIGGSLAVTLFGGDVDSLSCELETFALTALATFALKKGFPRTRPGGSADDSFPSGHTSAAFMAAAQIDARLDGPWAVAAYGLAGLTGFSRIESDRHYLSDVLAGAAVGLLTTGVMEALHWGTGREGKGIAGAKLEIEYLDRGAMVGLSFRF